MTRRLSLRIAAVALVGIITLHGGPSCGGYRGPYVIGATR